MRAACGALQSSRERVSAGIMRAHGGGFITQLWSAGSSCPVGGDPGPGHMQVGSRTASRGVSIDDIRYDDLIDVSEDAVFAFVEEHGFDPRVVLEDGVRDDRTCLVHGPDGWTVFYTERGQRSEEATSRSRNEARREIVRSQMRLARIMLNNRYWHAHDLPFPITDHDG
jgi:hypothetical protein